MADFDPPSFSLGLDFDLDSPPPTTHADVDPDFEIPTSGRALKRLKRVPGSEIGKDLRCDDVDDDIEDFSSEEGTCIANKLPSSRPYSGISTSKLSLRGHKILTSQPTAKCKTMQKEQVIDVPSSSSIKSNGDRFTFPKLTVSPLRKFQLLTSDSESESDSDSDSDFEADKVNPSSKAELNNHIKNQPMSGRKRGNAAEGVSKEHDLWEDFYAEKNFSIPTPALDEVCDEYFKSVKNSRTDPPSSNVDNSYREINNCVQTHIIIDDDGMHCKLDEHVPPAHKYFYHDDPRVRDLVHSRLPHFFPLGATNGRNQSAVPSVIDYRDQFNHETSSKPQAPQKSNPSTSSKRPRKNSKKSNIEEVQASSGSWVNPRVNTSIPTDAGKRRVHAVGGSGSKVSGHWFTSPEGKKVYVSKTGQELSGRAAYANYRKESGKGFKKSGGKKKGAPRKRNVGKKKTTAAKKK